MTTTADQDADLTARAFEILTTNLTGYGNTLSPAHGDALHRVVSRFTSLANGASDGRWGYDLPCGAGKTEAAKAWCAALVKLGKPYSVAISAAKVEALCELKRGLLRMGVAESDIGLMHSYGAKASEPATSEEHNESAKILLLSHNKLRGPRNSGRMPTYNGDARSLLIYDESLIISDGWTLDLLTLADAVTHVRNYMKFGASPPMELALAVSYGDQCIDMLTAEFDAQKAGAAPSLMSLPDDLDEVDREILIDLLGDKPKAAELLTLLRDAPAHFRVVATNRGGVVWYDLRIPHELEPVCVLDASLVIRELPLEGGRLLIEDGYSGAFKRHSRVEVRQMLAGGGRGSMESAFAVRRENRDVSKEVVAVVRTIPDNEGVIIWSFKHRGIKKAPNILSVLKSDLEDAGIDTGARIIVDGVERPRFAFLTWGNETSTNDYAYCSNVIMAGILHRSHEDLAAAVLGQRDDLLGYVGDLERLQRSEVAHCVYQALCRGSCRASENGEARPMKAWLIHAKAELEDDIRRAMPGIVWGDWEPVAMAGSGARKTRTVAEKVARYLDTIDQKISTTAIKRTLGLVDVPRQTFTDALSLVLGMRPAWKLEGRSLMPVGWSKNMHAGRIDRESAPLASRHVFRGRGQACV